MTAEPAREEGGLPLDRAGFEAARKFLETAARPLELARFRHHFAGAPASAVVDALEAYRNPDGGFGRALEPDLWAPESSALCTSVAFRVLGSIRAGPEEPMIAGGVDHLLRTLDRERLHWRIIPASAAMSPHAPWWDQPREGAGFDEFSLNPTAEILGVLFEFPGRVPEEVLTRLSERVIRELTGTETIRMHELLCCLRLRRAGPLPENLRERLRRELARHVESTVVRGPSEWGGYGLRPLHAVDHPDSPFLAGLEGEVAANLDFLIATQQEDGSWVPNWDWAGAYPEAWPRAEIEWSGVLTARNLILLDRFGRIEGRECDA
jgi:hypothetical protein